MKRFLNILVASVMLAACGQSPEPDTREKLAVSIAPLKGLIDSLTCGDFDITVLVPPGESPETFSPDPSRIRNVSDSKLYFSIGLMDFERELSDRFGSSGNPYIVKLAEGVDLEGGSEGHGADPHVWLSPSALKIMLHNAAEAINNAYPDSVKYETAYLRLRNRLDSLDRAVGNAVKKSGRKSFVIYHPALTYYARDYGLAQIAVETEGKEPTAAAMKHAVRKVRSDSIRYVLYQREYSPSVVETLSGETSAVPAQIDPLDSDLFGQINHITELITAP